MTVVHFADSRELLDHGYPTEWPALGAGDFAYHPPDAALVVREGRAVRARCALWWTGTPSLSGARTGTIGYFAASSAEATTQLLDAACDHLRTMECARAVGPMDGTTWRKYRFVTETGTEPPFLMEPVNPPQWPVWFAEAGFGVIGDYSSGVNTDLTAQDPRVPGALERLTRNGVAIRSLRPEAFEEELSRIFRVSEVAFRSNFLYTPIAFDQFAAQYQRAREFVVPELVFIAEQGEKPVGFCFTIPDLQEKMRGETLRSVIIKTVAILPDRLTFGGLGSVMVDQTHAVARRLGFTRAIHALMHDSNQSRRISDRTGHVIRRYALFGRALTST